MGSALFDIDHIMISVRDSNEAAEVFLRMGFTTTPKGNLPGLSNRLVCFDGNRSGSPNFIEMMSLVDSSKAPPTMAVALKSANKPVLIVAATRDAEKTRTYLLAAGMKVSPVIDGERDWTLADGEVLDLAFSIVLPQAGQAPFHWIACQHKTPHHYRRPEFVTHSNDANLLKNIITVSDNPVKSAGHYEKYWGARIITKRQSGSPVIVTLGEVELHIYDRGGYSQHFPGVGLIHEGDHIAGFTVRVAPIAKLEAMLKSNGFSPVLTESAIVVPPEQACGCLVIFEENRLDVSQLDLGPLPI